jgi:2-oxo-3-(phosphooxy)propyl 3-oxoalkanoate synthase
MDTEMTDEPNPKPVRALMPGSLVHRRQLTEVLLTGVERVDETAFRLGVQWPRRHAYFGPWDASGVAVRTEIALETLRQSVIAMSHTHLGVPFGYGFLIESMGATVPAAATRPGDRPLDLVMEVELADLVERKGVATQVDSRFTIRDGDAVLATGRGLSRAVPPAIYARMRRDAVRSDAPSLAGTGLSDRSDLLPAAVVGVRDDDQVLLRAETGDGRYALSVEPSEPVYFDHPLDHVPGMVVREAAFQAVRAHTGDAGRSPCGVDIALTRHLELSSPVSVHVAANPDGHEIVFVQDGEESARMVTRER